MSPDRPRRLRRALAAGLTRPILGAFAFAFALVLVVVTGMVALQVLGARQAAPGGGERPSRRAGPARVQRARAPRDRPRDRPSRLPAHGRGRLPGAPAIACSRTPRAPGAARCGPRTRSPRDGGEEFALLLPHCHTDTAEAIAAPLLGAVPGGQTASCGIAEWDGAETAAELTARADAALYAAKRRGRAQAVLV